MEGQYFGSSREGQNYSSDEHEVFSGVGSQEKPPAVGSDIGPPDIPVDSNNPLSTDVFSDVGSVGSKPPMIISSRSKGDVVNLNQPTEGVPVTGVFSIKVRDRSQPSNSVLCVYKFDLAPNTTFGQLLDALTKRHFQPFLFRKIGVAYFGCRDFMCVPFLASPQLSIPGP